MGVHYAERLTSGGDMEDHDGRVIEARAALAEARKRDPGDLTTEELKEEVTRFRKYVRWLIDLADDAADTEIEEEVSQITIWGGASWCWGAGLSRSAAPQRRARVVGGRQR
jgi:hypothetical protein